MDTLAISTKKINNELNNLKRIVRVMDSLLIGIIGQDKEGKYKPEFVKKIIKAIGEKAEFSFNGKRAFLSQIGKI